MIKGKYAENTSRSASNDRTRRGYFILDLAGNSDAVKTLCRDAGGGAYCRLGARNPIYWVSCRVDAGAGCHALELSVDRSRPARGLASIWTVCNRRPFTQRGRRMPSESPKHLSTDEFRMTRNRQGRIT